MRFFYAGILVFVMGVQVQAADKLTVFLKSCAYGTLGGAAVGLATLAFSENPGGKINNVSRGASLGLYAGIGYGLFQIYGNPKKMDDEASVSQSAIWITPLLSSQKIQGAQLNWAQITF